MLRWLSAEMLVPFSRACVSSQHFLMDGAFCLRFTVPPSCLPLCLHSTHGGSGGNGDRGKTITVGTIKSVLTQVLRSSIRAKYLLRLSREWWMERLVIAQPKNLWKIHGHTSLSLFLVRETNFYSSQEGKMQVEKIDAISRETRMSFSRLIDLTITVNHYDVSMWGGGGGDGEGIDTSTIHSWKRDKKIVLAGQIRRSRVIALFSFLGSPLLFSFQSF